MSTTSTGSFTDYQVGLFFATLPSGLYLGLHYSNPALGGVGSAEFSGGTYVRQALSLSAMASRAAYNTNPMQFSGLLASAVAYLGVWDAPAVGVLRAYVSVLPNAQVSAGGTFAVNVGDLALTF